MVGSFCVESPVRRLLEAKNKKSVGVGYIYYITDSAHDVGRGVSFVLKNGPHIKKFMFKVLIFSTLYDLSISLKVLIWLPGVA